MLDSKDLQAFLHSHAVQARLMHLDEPTPTVSDAADAVGVKPDQIIKSLLFLISDQPVLAIANGLQDVDRRVLARYFEVGRKRVKLAEPGVVLEITGYPVGAVPPVGWKTQVQAFIDPSIFHYEWVYAGGGEMNALVEISPHDIQRLSGAVEQDLYQVEADR
jgi:prolyl-tRNA editing enzyme YbaK/EbsC (Cys-tRNA(Pro) deacylase)